MLQNGSSLVLLDAFRHHVEDIVHDRGTKLEIEVRLDSLLCHSLRHTLGMTTFELTRQKVSEPAFEKGCYSAHEEEPDAPTWSPKSAARTFANWALLKIINFV
jgi:hypothetical protein